MAEEIEQLIETYRIKVSLVLGQLEAQKFNTGFVGERLNAKLECYRAFIRELQAIK